MPLNIAEAATTAARGRSPHFGIYWIDGECLACSADVAQSGSMASAEPKPNTASHRLQPSGRTTGSKKAAVAKTSLYRHFGTKDDLIAAFLEREDADFWAMWDRVARQHAGDAAAELDAHFEWIGERVGRPNYCGCPQVNVAAEFPDIDHSSGP